MDASFYDEFGNYIGPAIDDGDADGGADGGEEAAGNGGAWGRGDARVEDAADSGDDDGDGDGDDDDRMAATATTTTTRSVVLHEDKRYYADAKTVYGPDVETLVQDEDAQPLSEPIIAPVKAKNFQVAADKRGPFPALTYSKEFMQGLMEHPALVRNVALVGHLHHGKTSWMDVLVQQTHDKQWQMADADVRYTDVRKDEQERGLSIKAQPMSVVLATSKSKSYLVHLLDTPGHVNFSDEVTASLRLCDGVVLVVDAIEGVMLQTRRLIRQVVREQLPVVLLLNKVDRLILELKLPPADAYYKLRHVIDDVNHQLELAHSLSASSAAQSDAPVPRVSPELGNVCFASATAGWCFSLRSFAALYASSFQVEIDPLEFSRRLWGDLFFNPETRRFRRTSEPLASGQRSERSFVHFILEPLYKIYSQVVGEDRPELEKTLAQLGIHLRKAQYELDTRPLLKLVLSSFLGTASAFVDMLVEHLPAPSDPAAARRKVQQTWTGDQQSGLAAAMARCDPEGPLLVQVAKLLAWADGSRFHALARVMSGTLRVGERVSILREAYTPEDDEDQAVGEVSALALSGARYQVAVGAVPPGNWVLIDGVDEPILKTATLTTPAVLRQLQDEVRIFRPLAFDTRAVVKIAVEPIKPADLPKMLAALSKVNKSYPLAVTKVEESGEHVVLGTGELYLDSIMHDLRRMYADIEVKVSDPVVCFCETVVETSSIKCYAESPNRENKLTMTAEPLDRGLADDIEAGVVNIRWDRRQLGDFFQSKYHWDLLAARSVWAFGPDAAGPNALLDDTLPKEVDKRLLAAVKDSVAQGFQWAAREGPLCEEPLRNVKFKLLHATVAANPLYRIGAQVTPTARRVAYSSFLTATPRLMEPYFFTEIQAPLAMLPAVFAVLQRRRGHPLSQEARAGSPLYTVTAHLPVLDSFGFETDLRAQTQGQAFCLSVFDHWDVVPGDPLDRSIVLRPLEPAPAQALAREILLKTRRRKGLSEDVSAAKFFDAELLAFLAADGSDAQFV